jgi:cardiolipin synthase
VVIDGVIGYSTGNNIGDEYINRKQPYGHWNDAGIRLEGRAVWSLTLTFFNTLEFVTHKSFDYQRYFVDESRPTDGYVIPFADTPLDKEETTKNLYLSLIYSATERISITTPYLIIDHEFKNALQYAAKSGIEIEIIIPKIPDKKLVYMVTESHLPQLLKSGVKVYRYTPGFIHSKMRIVDGRKAMIGTANLDYRSLYLHFENTVYLASSSTIASMENYFQRTKEVSQAVDSNEKHSLPYRFFQVFFKMFSGLL